MKENSTRMLQELDKLAEIGVNSIRVLATTQGPNTEPWRMKPAIEQWDSRTQSTVLDEEYLTALDKLLVGAQQRNMSVVVVLNNFWFWSGGFAQYVNWYSGKNIPIPYPMDKDDKEGHKKYLNYTQEFYNCDKCKEHYIDVTEKIILRKNKENNLLYKDDPTIMAWELVNGPFPVDSAQNATKWISSACNKIKAMDKNHMVAIGNNGITQSNYIATLSLKCIDYGTIHVWPQNSGWYDPKRDNETYKYAKENTTKYLTANIEGIHNLLNQINDDKPLVLEEFGLARDKENYSAESSTYYRDMLYTMVFEMMGNYMQRGMVSGVNFWAWAGKGRPNPKNHTWNQGDDWIGDPPNENQGWYSIYDTDSTIEVIRRFSKRFVMDYEIKDHSLHANFWICMGAAIAIVSLGMGYDFYKRRTEKDSAELLTDE